MHILLEGIHIYDSVIGLPARAKQKYTCALVKAFQLCILTNEQNTDKKI